MGNAPDPAIHDLDQIEKLCFPISGSLKGE